MVLVQFHGEIFFGARSSLPMASPAEAHSSLLGGPALSISAPHQQEQYSTEPQELPADAEEMHNEFSPEEEYSTNDQPEEQQPKVISSHQKQGNGSSNITKGCHEATVQ